MQEKNYYPNSQQLESEGERLNNELHGNWKWYYENGQLKKEGHYDQGKASGHFYFYHENL